ncbi:MAG: ATP-binding protein [Acidobacteriota bacterium]
MMKRGHILAVVGAVCLLLGIAGTLYYRSEYRSITERKDYEITTIGTLKIRQIEQWHKELESDVRVVLQTPYYHQAVDNWLRDRKDTAVSFTVARRLAQAKSEFGFENIFLSSLDGSLLFSLDSTETSVCPASLEKIQAAASAEEDVASSDFYLCPTHHKIHYDFIAPIRNRNAQMIAALVFRLDPNEYLYPLVQEWPTPSRTAETMILRRERDSVMFLNELRHKPNSALRFLVPLSRKDYVSVKASLDQGGIYHGRDYRGVEVLGFSGRIPGTSWILVAKVDASEVFSELYYRAAVTGILTIALILLVLSGAAYFYNARQKNLYHALFEKERMLHEQVEESKRLEYQLFRSQRAESIGTLAAGIAHDFNNILNVIIGNAELLSSGAYDAEKTPRRINAIIKASERGSHVVRQLLAVARKTDIQHLPVNLNDVILDLSRLLSETFPKTISIVLDLMPDPPMVNGDVNQLHQVLLNLSVNARDAMPEGGTLSFRTSVVERTLLAEQFPDLQAAAYLRLEVSDTGTGMDEATRKQIFDPFFTTKEKGKGTGLGLAVAQGIIGSHAGAIDVHSEPGAGSRFDVYLPVIAPRSLPIEETPADAGIMKTDEGHGTILYIEDEEAIREVVVDLLESHGYRVLTAADGERGVELFLMQKEQIALVFSDYGLPKIDGAEVFARIRRVDPAVPFIILTGYMPAEKRMELLERGLTEIISKPHKPEELLSCAHKYMHAQKRPDQFPASPAAV